MKNHLAAVCLTITVGMPAIAQAQITTIDVNSVQELAQLKQQLENMKNQLETQKNALENARGITGYGNAISGIARQFDQYPEQASQIYQKGSSLSSQGQSALDSLDNQRKAEQETDPAQAVADAKATYRENQMTTSKLVQQVYDENQKNRSKLQDLQSQLASAQTQKQVDDLNAGIQAAQASIQAGNANIASLNKIASAQRDVDRDQLEQAQRHASYGDVGKSVSFTDPGAPSL